MNDEPINFEEFRRKKNPGTIIKMVDGKLVECVDFDKLTAAEQSHYMNSHVRETKKPFRHCCYIGCERQAEYEIWAIPDERSIFTDACIMHVGDLMNDADEFRVLKVKSVELQPSDPQTR